MVFGSASDITGGDGVFELSDIETGDGSLGFVLNGVSAGDESGRSVSSAGDVNGDGLDDLIVGAFLDDPNGASSGASFVVFGSASDITGGDGVFELSDIETGDGSLGFVFNGVSAGDRAGVSVSAAGDVNGDGFDDVIIGADSDDPNGVDSGASFVFFGADFTNAVTHQGTAGADTLTGDGGNNVLVGGLGADTINGGGGADVLRGGAGDDTLFADAGDDKVFAGTGDDTIIAASGAGNDIYHGDGGSDTAVFTSATMTVTVNLTARSATGAEIGIDRLCDIENVIGGAGADTITGNAVVNSLTGGAGADRITGGLGKDAIEGGAGADTLVWTALGEGSTIAANGTTTETGDTLAGFVSGLDVLEFDAAAFGLAAGAPVEGVSFSVIGAAFDGTNPGVNTNHDGGAAAFVFSTADDKLYYDANGDAAGYEVVATIGSGDDVAVGDINLV